MRDLGRGVGAELTKALRHPVIVVIGVLFVFMAQDGARTATRHWASQADVAAQIEAQYEGPCPEAVDCDIRELEIDLNRPLWENSDRSAAQAAALSSVGGAVSFASFRLAAGLGWLAMALIAVVVVTGERHGGSAPLSVLTSGGRLRLLGRKAAAVTVVSAGLGTVTAIVVFATQRLFAPTVAIPDPPVPEWEPRSMVAVEPWAGWVDGVDVAVRVLVTLTIVAVICAVACVVAAFFTNMATASAAVTTTYLLGLFVGLNTSSPWWTPAGTIGGLLEVGDVGPRMSALPFWPTTISGFDDLYTPRAPLAVPVGQGLLWVGVVVVVVVAGAWWIRRSPAGLG